MARVVVLGASKKEDRYSYRAVRLLVEKGHSVVPIHPLLDEILGQKVVPTIKDVTGDVDTLTLYVNPKLVEKNIDDIIAMNPKRIIANPGTESDLAIEKFREAGIEVLKACTLVMFTTNQF